MFAVRAQFPRFRNLFVLLIVISLASGLGGVSRGYGASASSLAGCLQPPAGLVIWWPLDSIAGGTTEELMQDWDGHLFGAPLLVPAKVSLGLKFDGVDDYVSPQVPVNYVPATIDAWVWVDGFTGSEMYIVSFVSHWLGITKVGDSYYFAANIQNDVMENIRVIGSVPVQQHTWYHVAMTYDWTALSLYVNGEQVATAALTSISMAPVDFFIAAGEGGASGADHLFSGIIDEVEIFNWVLAASELQAIYTAGSAGKCKCLPPATGLVSWWPGDGNAKDFVGKNHGTLINDVQYSSFGAVDTAFKFDGVDDYVQVPDSISLKPYTALTLNAWVMPHAISATFMDIAGKDPELAGGIRSYFLNVFKDGTHAHFRAHLFTGNDGFQVIDGSTPVSAWGLYNVTMTYDGAALKLYVNGNEDASQPMTGLIQPNTEPFRIGGGAPAGQPQLFFDGQIDEVQLYNVALSPSEIQAIYDYGVLGQCKYCQIYLPLVRRN